MCFPRDELSFICRTKILCCIRLNRKIFCYRTYATRISVSSSISLRLRFLLLFLGLMLETITKWICFLFLGNYSAHNWCVEMCGKCEQQRKMKVGATSYGWVDLLIYGFSQIHAIHTHVRVDSFILAFFTSLSLLRSLGLRFCLKSQQIKGWLIDTNFGSHYSINVIKDETSLLSIFLSKLFGYGPKSDLDWEKETIQSFRYKAIETKLKTRNKSE